MKKLFVLLLTLCLMLICTCASADETRTAETPVFSLELPEGWVIDEVEDAAATRAMFGAMAQFMTSPRQYTVRMDNGIYGCTLYVYKFPAQDKRYVDQFSDKAKSGFLVLNQYGGMNKYESQMNPQPLQFDTDTRTFICTEIKGQQSFVASYYNQKDGLGYYFYLSPEYGHIDKNYDSATAEALMKECLLALKEPGVNTTIDPNASRVVITGDSAKVRTEASLSAGLIKTVYNGESFICMGTSGDFYIIVIDGKTGYVHKGVSAIR